MTGLLAAAGIVIVLAASAYTGLTEDEAIDVQVPGFEITPVTDVDSDDDPVDEEATPEPTATPAAPAPSPTQVLNRLNCDQIRGTQYFSPEERTWFLANCVNN